MNPMETLISEHRLIERVVAVLTKRAKRVRIERDSEFLTTIVDFFRAYTDQTHHGKEEGILFRELAKKQLSSEHAALMKSLVAEHEYARQTTRRLDEAESKFNSGENGAIAEISLSVKNLVTLYPFHIEKEEKRFFYPALEYLSQEEQEAILKEFSEFDSNRAHDKYDSIVEALEKASL